MDCLRKEAICFGDCSPEHTQRGESGDGAEAEAMKSGGLGLTSGAESSNGLAWIPIAGARFRTRVWGVACAAITKIDCQPPLFSISCPATSVRTVLDGQPTVSSQKWAHKTVHICHYCTRYGRTSVSCHYCQFYLSKLLQITYSVPWSTSKMASMDPTTTATATTSTTSTTTTEPKKASKPRKPQKAPDPERIEDDGPPVSVLQRLTAREENLLLNAWLCMKELPEVSISLGWFHGTNG